MTDWTDRDLQQMRALGVDPSSAASQLSMFRHPPSPIQLKRPAVVGDGVRVLEPSEIKIALQKYEEARVAGRFQKFVPASGAATRMFQVLNRLSFQGPVLRDRLEKKETMDEKERALVLGLLESLGKLAFARDLRSALETQGLDLGDLLAQGNYAQVLKTLLSPAGLDYSRKPKGLIPFHGYPQGARSPMAEHLWEAALTILDSRGRGKTHFTVSPEHQKDFEREALLALAHLGGKAEGLDVTFSTQKSSTDTLAAEDSNDPFRDPEGNLVFRPGGHGALLENLNDLRGDLVYVKNIDNVARESFLEPTVHWKKILGGVLVQIEEEFRSRGGWESPLRVCGVVRNTGEPGGGPFWVSGKDGKTSLQIVESSQLDLGSPGQVEIFKGSSHFNPVDLVCSLRDNHGKPFHLPNFVDPDSVFFSRKSHLGRDLRALELPGLWNGAMAGWTTVFVEVPLETFNPVKTVFDLLKPAHL